MFCHRGTLINPNNMPQRRRSLRWKCCILFFETTVDVLHTGKLELFEADLLKEGSFDAGVKGADYLFHTARCAS